MRTILPWEDITLRTQKFCSIAFKKESPIMGGFLLRCWEQGMNLWWGASIPNSKFTVVIMQLPEQYWSRLKYHVSQYRTHIERLQEATPMAKQGLREIQVKELFIDPGDKKIITKDRTCNRLFVFKMEARGKEVKMYARFLADRRMPIWNEFTILGRYAAVYVPITTENARQVSAMVYQQQLYAEYTNLSKSRMDSLVQWRNSLGASHVTSN